MMFGGNRTVDRLCSRCGSRLVPTIKIAAGSEHDGRMHIDVEHLRCTGCQGTVWINAS